jgi:ABC-type lipoprotein export system ATPase subunit
MGPSGSGKSTLLQLMAGLDHPTAGRVTWPQWGRDPFRDPTRAGLVPQGAALMPALNVLDNVALPLLLRGVDPRDAAARARVCLELVHIEALAGKAPDELSGGQAQRVAVARAVSSRPALLIADEPTGRLDRDSAERVLDVLAKASADTGSALVVATHDPRVAERLDAAVWRMHDGELRVAA